MDWRGDGRWLAVLTIVTALELGWWTLSWRAGLAPVPRLGTYLAFSIAAFLAALLLRLAFRRHAARASWRVMLTATFLIALGASLFLPIKYAIPSQMPFWLDAPLALGERQLFGTDAWLVADRLLGWALVPVDRIYGLWLPVQSLVLFGVILLPAAPAKSRALIAYGLAWFMLGIVAATLCASAGPIFYDRLLGGHQFAGLSELLSGDAWMVRAESDAMWVSFATGRSGLVAGISAMPSLHVAISFWMWLASRDLAPRLAPFAFAYAVFIWVASVQLGWHYVSDGVAGFVGMIGIWWLAKWIVECDSRRSP